MTSQNNTVVPEKSKKLPSPAVPDASSVVITIGGANGERVLSPKEIKWRSKHTIDTHPIVAGGSAVNHSCRLMAVGIPTYPILPLVKDEVGKVVSATLVEAARRGGCTLDVTSIYLNVKNGSTPFSTILVQGPERTIFTEVSATILEAFFKHYHRRMEIFQRAFSGKNPRAVMIGHIHADSAAFLSGTMTQTVIENFSRQEIPVFTNFGSSQYSMGAVKWDGLLPKLACFQLDINEIRDFCRPVQRVSLEEILDWFRDQCSVVITMERFGAVGRLKGSDDIILAWPFDLDSKEIVDTTGAGDAFCAGVVASAIAVPLKDEKSLKKAMEQGRTWGARACLTSGGAKDCPNLTELDSFAKKHTLFSSTQVLSLKEARPLLRILDRAFPYRSN